MKENDPKKLLRLAEQGHTEAQYRLGKMYHKGIERDYGEAMKWFKKAAEQGQPHAQYRLGKMYHRGQGTKENYVEAIKWYRKAKTQYLKAAEKGQPRALYRLGEMYQWGYGVVPNKIEAVKWYHKAAEKGHTGAQYNLGWIYYDDGEDEDAKKDRAKAVYWCRKAAKKGHTKAQYNLGFIYDAHKDVDHLDVLTWRKTGQKPCIGIEKPQKKDTLRHYATSAGYIARIART